MERTGTWETRTVFWKQDISGAIRKGKAGETTVRESDWFIVEA
jgi:hypothetical protein